ncbi:MAG: 4Fe-4S dicluster domain-containing protein [Pseudomonadota bacterium]
MKDEIVRKVREAGVVGAGGAGFPTHVKLQAEVDVVLANGASCEPLLMSDPYLLEHEADAVLEGLRLAMAAVGASRGIVCLKGKHGGAMSVLRRKTSGSDQAPAVFELGDFYPAGDEHVLVHEVLGRTIPQGGLPLQVGVVVSNVESLFNVARAWRDQPVTERYLTVTGAVAEPIIVKAPVGMSAGEIIDLAGGPTIRDYRIVAGGPMMGRVLDHPNRPITKLTSGLIVLPADHNVVAGKIKDPAVIAKITKLACCQCTLCTELCPRYLLGHALRPHQIMRGLNALPGQDLEAMKEALLCSECGICEKFACPMMISPREVNARLKKELSAQGFRPPAGVGSPRPSSLRPTRYIPTQRLTDRLDLTRYARHPRYVELTTPPARVSILLRQHLGAPARPVVKVGDLVKKGDLLGEPPEKALGARIHAGLEGRVSEVSAEMVVIDRDR